MIYLHRCVALLALSLSAGCAGDSSHGSGMPAAPAPLPAPTPAAPAVSYTRAAMPQMKLSYAARQVMVTLLRDDMVHIAFNDRLEPGLPYFSPMVAPEGLTGPHSYAIDEAQARLDGPQISVQLDGACLRIASTGADARTLTRVCPGGAPLTVGLSAEDTTEVLGMGQYLSTARTSPSWLGLARTPASRYGNAMQATPGIGAAGDTQIPVAYVLGPGKRNYGMFFDSPYPLTFSFTGSQWSVASPVAALGLFVFSGASLPELRRDYLDLTGHPPVPPLKAFGMWLSEYGFDNWAELEEKTGALRSEGYPLDGAVLDLQWFGGIVSGADTSPMGRLAWSPTAFPGARERLASYQGAGLAVVLIEESYVGAALPEHQELAARGLLATVCPAPCTTPAYLSANPWWGKGGMIDWSNPAAASYWHDTKRSSLLDDGVLGHWTDLGEPEMYLAGAYYHGFSWYGADVKAHPDIHNLYNFFWNRAIAQQTARTHPQRRPWILSRSGAAGSQRHGVGMWSGDTASSFATLGAQMTAQANMSMSGFDYYGSDVGGFERGAASGATLDALYTRWFVTSALLDIPLRPHVSNLCNCNTTAPNRVGERASNLAALKLRYQLTPYLYSLAHAAWRDGDALFPPLAYHFQEDSKARAVDRSKMIGPWLLFTGLVSNAAEVDTYLPAGRWSDFYHPERMFASSGQASTQPVTVDVLVRAPLFVRPGAIVPTLRSAPPNLGAGAAGMHWFDDLVVRVYPTLEQSSFTMTEDDGVSRAYQSGKLARTVFSTRQDAQGGATITVRPDNRSGQAGRRKLAFDVISAAPPGAVSVDGKAVQGWSHSGGLLRIELGDVDIDTPHDILITPTTPL